MNEMTDKTEASGIEPVAYMTKRGAIYGGKHGGLGARNLIFQSDASTIIAQQAETIERLTGESEESELRFQEVELAEQEWESTERTLRTQLAERQAEVERLRGEIDAAKKDAERYRWLRDLATPKQQDCWIVRLPEQADKFADEAIDAARAEAGKEGAA